MMKTMKEVELVELFCKEIGKLGIVYKRELRKGSYHNEGYVDIVSITEDSNINNLNVKLICYEAKINGITTALQQACGNSHSSFLSYVIYPLKPRNSTIEKFQNLGIGLILYSKGKFIIKVKPRMNLDYRKRMYGRKLIRNWIENREGRAFSEREIKNEDQQIPINYNWSGNSYLKCPFCKSKSYVCIVERLKRWCISCDRVYHVKDNPALIGSLEEITKDDWKSYEEKVKKLKIENKQQGFNILDNFMK